jgi:hypothetical protein
MFNENEIKANKKRNNNSTTAKTYEYNKKK